MRQFFRCFAIYFLQAKVKYSVRECIIYGEEALLDVTNFVLHFKEIDKSIE